MERLSNSAGEVRNGLAGRLGRIARALVARDLEPSYAAPPAATSPVLPVGPNQFQSQAARGAAPPRRYTGRSASQAPGRPITNGKESRQRGAAPVVAPPAETASTARELPWSLKLVVAVSLVLALVIGLRLTGIVTPPVDPPAGAEATHAALANVLSGRVGGTLDPVRYFPPPAPWYGAATVNPSAGLPLFTWVTAAGMQAFGAGEWLGRAVAVLFSALAGLVLFSVVRSAAGTRAGLYALLFYSISPFSVLFGQHFSSASSILASQALALAALCKWRYSLARRGQGGSSLLLGIALLSAIVAALLDPGSIFLALPAAYIFLAPVEPRAVAPARAGLARRQDGAAQGWRAAWSASPHRGKLSGYVSALALSAVLWRLLVAGGDAALVIDPASGGGGLATAVAALLDGGTYIQVVGAAMGKLLTILGALFLFAGLLRGARPPVQMLLHAWLAGGLLHVLADSSRIGRHEDVLLPLLLPASALVGVGAAWAASLPARLWLAINEQRRESDAEYRVSPYTSWLFDLPEERTRPDVEARPQAQMAFGKSVAQRAQQAGARARRAWIMGVGNFAVLGLFAFILISGWQPAQARLQPYVESLELKQIGTEVRDATPPGSRLVVVGPYAAELFFASERTGWAMQIEDFTMGAAQSMQRQGTAYLLSTDQEALGRHPDYVGLLTNYSVVKLGRNYILFDLNTKPAANDRLYFLESGHTLGGEFRRFWEQNGGVARLGYPISEEVEEENPLDGQRRRVQYFERAVLEYHPEYAGTSQAIMRAAVGRWVTKDRSFPPVLPFKTTPDRAYFEETGHMVKEAFLRFWQREGGLATFGYPISEELPEISSADGKVYTVQYFERARFEWHPTYAGTPDEVQLGLIGKQALEMRSK